MVIANTSPGYLCSGLNHVSSAADAVHFGGLGWIVGPEGEVLGVTSQERPFVTVEIDPGLAEQAKHTYPRYAI